MNLPFSEVWLVDFEFIAPSGENPTPVCMVAREVKTKTVLRLWQDELRERPLPPFSTGAGTLLVAYYASAEIGCFLALGWPIPERILDLYSEFRAYTNGTRLLCGSGLVGAMSAFGLGGIDATEKDAMRNLVMRGGPWDATERRQIIEYCETDVDALARLLPAMASQIDLPRALLRGRFMAAAARVERHGVPIDVTLHADLVARWEDIKTRLVDDVDKHFGVYEGTTFKHDRFAEYLVSHQIPWPRMENGRLDLKDDTFCEHAKIHPVLAPLHELRVSLSQLRLSKLAVGSDGRNRVISSAFGAATGRNAPSNTQSIFGPSVWIRGLIRPESGAAIAYVDWSQQEFGIAAALSRDKNMLAAYESGDPYLEFAKRAGAVPADATKKSHGTQRELYKTCALGVQFGMGEHSLAARIALPTITARNLLRDHRQVFSEFWLWSDSAADAFNLHGQIRTVFGWPLRNGLGKSDRTARNFPMQGNGAEMMRLAACLMTEAGIRVCAMVHDAFLVEAGADEIDEVVARVQQHMAAASRLVLSGFELRSDATIYRFPSRYADPRGAEMYARVTRLLTDFEAGSVAREPIGGPGVAIGSEPVQQYCASAQH